MFHRTGSSSSSSTSVSGGGDNDQTGSESGFSEYCLSEWFNATCSQDGGGGGSGVEVDHVVVMTTAHYGRMRSGRCVQMKYGQAGCKADVLGHLDEACSGRADCRYPVARLLAAGVTFTALEITDRKRSESALRNSHERFLTASTRRST